MSKVVYLIGHGRVSNNKSIEVPDRMTMHWLGHLGDVSNGLSYAFLAGELTAELNASVPKDQIPEHFLCGERADIDPVVDTKIKAFFDRQTAHPLGCTNPYVIYPRGRTNVSLSSIFKFLEMLSPSAEWHMYWTCCRGYLGKNNPLTSTYVKESGTVERLKRVDPEATPALASGGHKTLTPDFDSIRLVAKSDHNVVSDTKDIEQVLGQAPLAHQLINPKDMGRKKTASEWDGAATGKTKLEKAFATDW
ncbi:hypothetical protein [Terracidiphilus gabretensis]|jgi:hypothetical protein|uniref:hypothetical protein n=1 Tax=Terracidiphilus gabretensis TaxID=1577687 RepID=UPI00071BD163|nr:hypothetical protein [Terracidiphilus gabretensis]